MKDLENDKNFEKLVGLYRIFIDEYLMKKTEFELNIETDALYLTSQLEVILSVKLETLKNLIHHLPHDFMSVEENVEIWRYFLRLVQDQKTNKYQLKIYLNFMKSFYKNTCIKVIEDHDYVYLAEFSKLILMDIYGLLEASSEAEDLKSSELLVHFLLESVKFSLKSFLLDSSDSEGRKEFQTQLNDYMLEGIFFILCKINLKHKGYVLLNSATFELLRAYIIFIGKTGINFKAEISTLMGILLYNKLLSVDERVGIARELNTKEKIQVKILFDFLNFILSNNKFLELLYYFNDFSEVRAPLVQNILQIAFSIFQKVQTNEKQDESFKKYIKNFISGSILGFIEKKNDVKDLGEEALKDIKSVLEFKNELKVMKELIEEKPKKVLERFQALYEGENQEEKLRKMSIFMQECPTITEGKVTECLGREGDDYKEFRSAFFRTVNFKNLGLLPCLRRLFWCFHMQGETQIIERILNDFAVAFYDQNKDNITMNSDTVFGYTFSLIFLNTDLHKPQMVKKMTNEEFKRSVTSVVGKENKPPDEQIDQIYESIRSDEIKALKCLDMTKEDHIFEELWEFIHRKNNSRIESLELMLPDRLKETYIARKPEIKVFISDILTGKINQIVQNNIWFIVNHNIGNFQVIEELFDSLIQSLKSIQDSQKLTKLTKSFLDEIDLEKNKDMICYDKGLAWGIFAFTMFYTKAFKHSVNDFSFFLDAFLKMHKFYSSVLKDQFLIDSINSFSKVRKASKYINASRGKKSSFLDVFSGFLNKESSSGEEEIKLTHSSSTSLRIEKMLDGNSMMVYNLVRQAEEMSKEDINLVISYLERKIVFYDVTPRTMHLFAFIVNIYVEILMSREDVLIESWKRIFEFLTLLKTEEFESKFQLEELENDGVKEEPAEVSPTKVKRNEKRLKRMDQYLRNYSVFKLVTLQLFSLGQSHLIESFEDDLELSLVIFDNTAIDLLSYALDLFGESVDKLNLGEQEVTVASKLYENSLFLLKKFLKICEEKNLENELGELIVGSFYSLVESVIEKLYEIDDIEIFVKSSLSAMEFMTLFANSKVTRATKNDLAMIEIYKTFIEPLEEKIQKFEESKEKANEFLLGISENFFNFLLMTQNPNTAFNARILHMLIFSIDFDCISLEQVQKILDYLENLFKVMNNSNRDTKAPGLSSTVDLYKIYAMIFQKSIVQLKPKIVDYWCNLVKFSAERFIEAFQMKDENLAKCVLESLKKILSILKNFEEFKGEEEGSIKEEIKEISIKAGDQVSSEFKQALIKLL